MSKIDQIRTGFLGGISRPEGSGKSVAQVKAETEATSAAAIAEHGIVGTAGVTSETSPPNETFEQKLDRLKRESDARTATAIADIRKQSGQQ